MDLSEDIKRLVLGALPIEELESADAKANSKRIDSNSYEFQCNYYKKLIDPRFEKCD